jgi:hypothetical protein
VRDVESGELFDPRGDVCIDGGGAIEPAADCVAVLAGSPSEFVDGPAEDHEA